MSSSTPAVQEHIRGALLRWGLKAVASETAFISLFKSSLPVDARPFLDNFLLFDEGDSLHRKSGPTPAMLKETYEVIWSYPKDAALMAMFMRAETRNGKCIHMSS